MGSWGACVHGNFCVLSQAPFEDRPLAAGSLRYFFRDPSGSGAFLRILSTEGQGVCLCWAKSKSEGPQGPTHTVDYDPFIKSELVSTQSMSRPYVVQTWSRRPQLLEGPIHSYMGIIFATGCGGQTPIHTAGCEEIFHRFLTSHLVRRNPLNVPTVLPTVGSVHYPLPGC